MTTHRVVPHDEWITARAELLAAEKEFTRLRDQLSQQRRDLPWEIVDKTYAFDGPSGTQTLSEIFDGRSQLIVYHFMFNPKDNVGCAHCSFWADNFDDAIVHLNQRDVTMVAISRAPYEKLAAYEQRMGWTFKWLSSGDTDFNFDFQASFTSQQVSDKKALYNFALQDPGGPDREAPRTSYSTSLPRDAMRTGADSIGCAVTMSTALRVPDLRGQRNLAPHERSTAARDLAIGGIQNLSLGDDQVPRPVNDSPCGSHLAVRDRSGQIQGVRHREHEHVGNE